MNAAIALDVSSSASQSTVWPPGTVTTCEQVAERGPVVIEEIVVPDIRVLAEHEQRRDANCLERRRCAAHLSVGGNHGRLAVAVAPASVVIRDEEALQILGDVLFRRAPKAALLEPSIDSLRRTRRTNDPPARARRRAARSRGRAGSPDRGARAAPRASGRRAASSSARRPPNEWPIQAAGSAPTVATIASRCSAMLHGGSYGDAPWPIRSGARTWYSAEPSLREPVPACPAARDAVQADDARRIRITPRLDVERPASQPRALRATPGTISVRRLVLHERPDHDAVLVDQEGPAPRCPGLLVEDAVRLRGGAVLPEVGGERVRGAELLLPGLARGRGVARDEDDVGLGVVERLEIGLEVERLLATDRREGERVEDEEDVALAPERPRGSRAACRTRPRGRTPVPDHPSRLPSPVSSPLPEGT